MEFNQENVRKRLDTLAKEFGNNTRLAEASGMHKTTIGKYRNGKLRMTRRTWEKHFGPWDQDITMETNETTEQKPELEPVDVVEEEPAVEQSKETKSGLYIKAKNLTELEKILAGINMRLVVVDM